MRASQILSFVLQPATEQKLLGSNPRRVKIIIGSPAASQLFVRNTSLGNIVGGFNIATSSGVLELTLEEDGDLILGEWWGYSAAGVSLGIIEVLN